MADENYVLLLAEIEHLKKSEMNNTTLNECGGDI